MTPDLLPTPALAAYMDRFANRWDTWCLQDDQGRYARQWSQLGLHTLARHLEGLHTLALDSARRDGMTRWLCLDSDQPDGLAQLERVRRALADYNLVAQLEASRRGGHLWLLASDPVPSVLLRRIITAILATLPGLGPIEIYPVADVPSGTKGIAHPVRLPLGVHRVTGQRSPFVDGALRPCHRNAPQAGLAWLLGQPRNTSSWLHAALAQLTANLPDDPPIPRGARKQQGGIIRWANDELKLTEVIATTKPEAALRQTGQGFIGWCPWHDDAAPDDLGRPGTPSLYVVHNRRYGWSWRCLSTNCGAHDGEKMQHTFDWFVWCAAGDIGAAVASASQYQERLALHAG